MNAQEATATSRPWWCHFCHRTCPAGPNLHPAWALVMQCPVCPDCLTRAQQDYGPEWVRTAPGGQYAVSFNPLGEPPYRGGEPRPELATAYLTEWHEDAPTP